MDETAAGDRPTGECVREAVSWFLERAEAEAGESIQRMLVCRGSTRDPAEEPSDVDALAVWDGRIAQALETLVPIATDVLIETGVDVSVRPATPSEVDEMREMRTRRTSASRRPGSRLACFRMEAFPESSRGDGPNDLGS